MSRKKFFHRNPKKCPKTRKTMFAKQSDASYAMMRTWAHDTKADIYDLHTYKCEFCGHFHFGHISYFEHSKSKQAPDTVSIGAK
jgi:3-deoxy-D-arabino-heptulosonate 7-phosphate (DAHP) synthase class II